MIAFDAWQFPDGEAHLLHWMRVTNRRVDGRLTYQYDKYARAIGFCRTRRRAVDVGAHIGLWSFWMARDFAALEAFEPHPVHVACWVQNMAGWPAARVHAVALGARADTVALEQQPGSTGHTYIKPGAPGVIPMRTLDSYDLQDVDLLKVDCEGFEFAVLAGAAATITAWRPVIIVEQKASHGAKYGVSDTAGLEYLRTLGYRVRATLIGDVILTGAAA